MLGTLRLCLALLVALSHVDVRIAGLNPGVAAVVGFYLISGYVMTGVIRTHYSTLARAGSFYADRLLRLAPHYVVVAAATLAWFLATDSRTDYLTRSATPVDLVRNFLVVPMNFYMFNRSDQFALIPPSWSLGAEIQFYVLAPLLLLALGGRLRIGALALSVLVYAVASFGIVNSDWYGYRLIPGVLYLFMLGSMFYDLHHAQAPASRAWLLVLAIVVSVLVLAPALAYAGKLRLPYDRETLIGLVAGALAINGLAPLRRKRFDELLGNLGYGVFLNQFLVQWALFGGKVHGLADTTAYLLASVGLAAITYRFVEKPLLALRRNLRRSTSDESGLRPVA